MKDWNGKRYHSLNYFLRNKYGEKIYKIPLDGGFTCPNRDGKVAKGGCTFCSSHGSGDFAGSIPDYLRVRTNQKIISPHSIFSSVH